MKPILWAVLGASLVLAGCSQPLEGPGPGRDSNIPGLGITSFSVAGVKGEIAGTTIYVRDVPLYTVAQTLTDLRNAVPVIGYKGGTLSPAADTPQDFSTPKIYTLLTDDGSQWDYTVIVTARPLRSTAEIDAYFPIAAKVYAGTAAEPIPVPVGMELSAKGWREILTVIQNRGKYVALDLSACTAGIDMAGGGFYGDLSFDPGPAHSGENKVVSLVLPGEAERIVGGKAAAAPFKRYTALGSVVGAGIKDVGRYAFSGCDALTMVSLPEATSIGFDAFSNCDALTTVSLPEATSIGEAAFSDCLALTTISFPAATSIGTDAFSGCEALETVSLPEATSIGSKAFAECAALKVLDLFAATSIGTEAFSGCTGLTTVSLPEATSIGNNAFSGCDGLSSVDFPEARTIGNSAFSDCSALSTITLPEATTIGVAAFSPCTGLTLVSLPIARTIGGNAFAGCIALNTVSLPVARTIGDSAFSNCSALTSVYFPEVTIITASAFRYNTSLSSVDLPSATSIGANAFEGCTALKLVKIPSVTSISVNVFAFTGTETLTVTLGALPPTLGRLIFSNVTSTKNVTVKVPSGADYNSTPINITISCWGNGFRGGGWDGSGFVATGGPSNVNSNINLTIDYYTP
jgi:hypothetical protein